MPPRIERILLIQLRRLGDVILSTALLDDLRRALPNASVDMLVGAAHYDAVFDIQGSMRTAMITRASGAPLRVGWKVRAAPLAYTHALARGGAAEYVVRRRRRLLELVGIEVGTSLPRIALSERERL